MDYRKIIIRVLLFSLGIAGLSGLLAMFLPGGGEITGRLLGTAIITAVCAALFLFAVQRIEVQNTRLFGLSLGLFTTLVYLTGTIAIWIGLFNVQRRAGLDLEGRFGLSALLLVGCGILISLGFLCTPHKKVRFAGYVLSSIWFISLITWLLVLCFPFRPILDKHAGYFAFPLLTLFPIIVLCSIRRNVLYMGVAFGIALITIVCTQYALFTSAGSLSENSALFIFILYTGGASALLGITNIIQFRNKRDAIHWAEWITLLFVALTITLLCTAIYLSVFSLELPELLIRLSVGLSILTSTFIIGLLIIQMLRSSIFTLYDGVGLEGTCPRCNAHLSIPRGKSSCKKCGLRMKLQIESPHCRMCGYDISKMYESSSCPECGEEIIPSP